MAQVSLQIVVDNTNYPNQIGLSTNNGATIWFDEDALKHKLRNAALTISWDQIFEGIVRRLRDDGVNPRTATRAQIRNSIERAPLEV